MAGQGIRLSNVQCWNNHWSFSGFISFLSNSSLLFWSSFSSHEYHCSIFFLKKFNQLSHLWHCNQWFLFFHPILVAYICASTVFSKINFKDIHFSVKTFVLSKFFVKEKLKMFKSIQLRLKSYSVFLVNKNSSADTYFLSSTFFALNCD